MCYDETLKHKEIKIVISNCFGVGFDWNDTEFIEAVKNREERLFEILEWMANGGAKNYNEAVEIEQEYCRGSYTRIFNDLSNTNYNLYEVRQNPYLSQRAKNILDMYFSGELKEKSRVEKEEKKREIKSKTTKKAGIIYLLNSGVYYKIGKTKNLPARMETLAVGVAAPFDIKLIHHFKTNDYSGEERKLHNMFADKRTEGEWFTLSEKDVNYICSLRGDE